MKKQEIIAKAIILIPNYLKIQKAKIFKLSFVKNKKTKRGTFSFETMKKGKSIKSNID